MFDLIESLCSDYPNYSNHSHYSTANERLDKVHFLATQILKDLGFKSNDKNHPIKPVLDQDPFLMQPAYDISSGQHIIRLPALSLIRFHEIPDKFRDSFSTDSNINDMELLQEFSDWICDRLNFPRKEIEASNLESIKLYFRFMRDSEKAKLGMAFVFGHELSHFLNGDGKKMTCAALASNIAALIISLTLTVLLGQSVPIGILAVLFTRGLFSNLINNIVLFPYHRCYERQPDTLTVTKLPKTAPGAYYIFNLMRECQKEYRNRKDLTLKERIVSKFIFTPSGNNRLNRFTHYQESDRIKHIQKVIKNMSTTAPVGPVAEKWAILARS